MGVASISVASSLNFLICKRESKSGKIFNIPGMCSAENKILHVIKAKTNLLTKIMIRESYDVCEFTTCTTAELSEWKITQEFLNTEPHNSTARTIGNNSFKVIL